jgi:hypothetical protein
MESREVVKIKRMEAREEAYQKKLKGVTKGKQ